MIVARATADFHLSPVTARWVFQALEELRLDTEQRGGLTVICGDVLNIAEEVHAETFAQLYRMLRDWPADIILIPGNHDQYNAVGETVLEALISPRCAVCLCPTENEIGLCIPYTPPSRFWEAAKSPRRWANPKQSVWWTHQGWNGAYMNTMRRDHDGLPTAKAGADLVITGHYHLPHGIGNVLYCGSPYQGGFAEEGQEKSWLRWDGDELWPTRQLYTIGAPRHYTVHWHPEKGEPVLPEGAEPGWDRIRVVTEVDRVTARKAADQLRKAGLDNLPVIAGAPEDSIGSVSSVDPGHATEEWIVGRYGGDPKAPSPEIIMETARARNLWAAS